MARTRVLWAATVFLGSGLLFVVQPMIAKMLLPRVGGAPSTWTTCVLFFQAALLAGYLYAHFVARLEAPVQRVIHGAVLLLAVGLLPFTVASGSPGVGSFAPALWLLRELARSVGLPYVALAAGAPLVQAWIAGSSLPGGRDPYVLYAASNTGSLAALAAYPFLIEPSLGLSRQAALWKVAYVVYVVLVFACAILTVRRPVPLVSEPPLAGKAEHSAASALPWPEWVALAAAPSSLMLGVTSLLTADAAGLPFLWVLPLALYLLTFVLAFAARPGALGFWERSVPVAAVAFLLVYLIKATEPLAFVVAVYLAVFFVAAMACHGRLAERRPPIRQLTLYYACIGAGGVLGGAFNALVAPALFHDWLEVPLAFTLVCLLLPGRDASGDEFAWSDAAAAGGAFLLTAALVAVGDRLAVEGRAREAVTLAFPVLLTFLLSGRRYRFGLSVAAVLVAASLDTSLRGTVDLTERSFFGVHRVTRSESVEDGRPVAYRKLYHGNTIHGVQRADPATGAPLRPREPLAYYAPASAIARLLRSVRSEGRPLRVGLVGLGAGSLFAYAESGDRFRAFEIDPLVRTIAEDERFFSFLPEARRRGAQADVVLGDARLTLADSADSFDLLVLDAFTSDSIPVHLLTREALALYERRLGADGVMAFHVSNRHLDLAPRLRDTGEDLGLASTIDAELDAPPDGPAYVMASRWVFLARTLDALRARSLPSIVWLTGRTRGRIFTDDRSDLWTVFRF
jgi:hypothetical protein